MIRNKNQIFGWLLGFFGLVLLALLAMPERAQAVDEKSYFAVTKFNFQGADKPKTVDASLSPDLIYRVAFGKVDDVQFLLDKGADPESKNSAGLPVLLIATIRKDQQAPKIVAALLKAGANINRVSPDGNVAVLEAVKGGRPDVLQILIDHRAVLGLVRDRDGNDLLTIAENRGNLEIVNILNAGLENEKDKIQDLKSEDNFIKMVQEYAFLSCASEYLNFYISTQPEGVDMVKFNNVITGNNDEILSTAAKIKMLFRMNNKELGDIQGEARSEIVSALKFYETNENRALNGVGTDDDLNNRCEKIAKKWNASKIDQQQYKLNMQ